MMAAKDAHMQQKASAVGDRMPKTTEYYRSNLGTLHPPFDQNESLLDLNDDCLSEIVSYLSDIDLCAINDTCRRLKPLAVEEFRLRYKNKEYEIYRGFTENTVTSSILRTFGQLIVSLDLNEIGKNESQFLVKYCNSITEFKSWFGNYHIIDDESLRLIFKNVTHLTLHDIRVAGDVLQRIVHACENIKILNLSEVWFDSDLNNENFYDHEYPTIERFSCDVDTDRADSKLIARFIKRNQQLKGLALEGELHFDSDIIWYMKIIEHICLSPIDIITGIDLNRLKK